jgi:hypothetical protein
VGIRNSGGHNRVGKRKGDGASTVGIRDVQEKGAEKENTYAHRYHDPRMARNRALSHDLEKMEEKEVGEVVGEGGAPLGCVEGVPKEGVRGE